MKSLTPVLLLALLSTASALPNPQDTKPTTPVDVPAPTAAINTAEPTATNCAGTPGFNIPVILDTLVSNYNVWTGAITYNSRAGKIFKDGHSPDITTLATFNIPSWAAGHTCHPRLRLDDHSTSKVSGSGLFDVFTSLAPATASTTGWGPGNQRDQFVGRQKAVRPNSGTAASYNVDPTTNGGSFPCDKWAGSQIGVEYVGVYDVDDIEWDDRYVTAGPEMVIY